MPLLRTGANLLSPLKLRTALILSNGICVFITTVRPAVWAKLCINVIEKLSSLLLSYAELLKVVI